MTGISYMVILTVYNLLKNSVKIEYVKKEEKKKTQILTKNQT